MRFEQERTGHDTWALGIMWDTQGCGVVIGRFILYLNW